MNASTGLGAQPDPALDALRRLLAVAASHTGQAPRAANFLLAWHHALAGGHADAVAALLRRGRPGIVLAHR